MTDLPEFFCWSKVGAEAGETVSGIVARKEAGRARDGGVFLWGIGQAISRSIQALLERTDHPEVVFTDMIGPAKVRDRTPASTVLWRVGRGALDGHPFPLPENSLVTSHGARPTHWALVCRSDGPIDRQPTGLWLRKSDLRNIASGKMPADQQITTAVRYAPDPTSRGTRYSVRFRALLVSPYLLRLEAPLPVPPVVAEALSRGDPDAISDLRRVTT